MKSRFSEESGFIAHRCYQRDVVNCYRVTLLEGTNLRRVNFIGFQKTEDGLSVATTLVGFHGKFVRVGTDGSVNVRSVFFFKVMTVVFGRVQTTVK